MGVNGGVAVEYVSTSGWKELGMEGCWDAFSCFGGGNGPMSGSATLERGLDTGASILSSA